MTTLPEQVPEESAAGQDNAALQARREKAVVRGVSTLLPRFIERAENAQMWDVEGKRYIDFAGGIAVLNTGHVHPRVEAAVARADAALQPHLLPDQSLRGYVALAERLNALAPVPARTRRCC